MLHNEGQHDRTAGREFLRRISPFVMGGDLSLAADAIGRCWCCGQLCAFLRNPDSAVRCAAAMALALVGDKQSIEPLATALHDSEVRVNELADHALWSIWFRGGNSRSCCHLKCGTHHLKHGNLDTAIEKFSLAIEADPDFSEAYNQRAIGHYLAERYIESIADCKRALARMPPHFGAMAGMGHCHAHLGNLPEAQNCYMQALKINPRMEGVAAALTRIQQIMEKPAA